MAKDTYSTAMAYGRWIAFARLVATILSGKNADGSDFTLPVELAGGIEVSAETLELQTDQLESQLASVLSALTGTLTVNQLSRAAAAADVHAPASNTAAVITYAAAG